MSGKIILPANLLMKKMGADMTLVYPANLSVNLPRGAIFREGEGYKTYTRVPRANEFSYGVRHREFFIEFDDALRYVVAMLILGDSQ